MMLVRNTFQVKFGRMKEALALMKENIERSKAATGRSARLLTDVTGPFYTLVLEFEFESLAEMENSSREMMKLPGWQESYQKFSAVVDKGRREIFTIVA
jgi:hypothetical protein